VCKISFNINLNKAIEVILYLSNRVNNITFHKLLKMLFFADIYHLNNYGRPIVGDEYYALQAGPVASTIYDILKEDPWTIENLREVPFEIEKRRENEKIVPYIIPIRDYNPDELSISDEEALDLIIKKYKNCSFGDLYTLSHKHPAWYKAWERRECAKRSKIHYSDFIEPDNQELIEELEEHSKYMCL